MKKVFKIKVDYKPEKNDPAPESETFSFSTKEAADVFYKRQLKKPQVLFVERLK